MLCDGALFPAVYRDQQDCLSLATDSCERSFTLPDTQRTSAEVSACAQEIDRADCRQLALGVCNQPGLGRRTGGQPCVSGSQCASLSCLITEGAGCGQCNAQSAQGGGCRTNGDCRAGLACQEGRCRSTKTFDSPCTGTEQCPGALVCRTGVCASIFDRLEVVLVEAGQPCRSEPGRIELCRAGSYCRDSVCVAQAPTGGACTTSDACSTLDFCIQGKCQPPDESFCGGGS